MDRECQEGNGTIKKNRMEVIEQNVTLSEILKKNLMRFTKELTIQTEKNDCEFGHKSI